MRERESRVGRGGIMRGRQETRVWESGGAWEKIAAAMCLPPTGGAYSNLNRPNWKPNRPHIGPVEQAQKNRATTLVVHGLVGRLIVD